jgi:hypothetical protein
MGPPMIYQARVSLIWVTVWMPAPKIQTALRSIGSSREIVNIPMAIAYPMNMNGHFQHRLRKAQLAIVFSLCLDYKRASVQTIPSHLPPLALELISTVL